MSEPTPRERAEAAAAALGITFEQYLDMLEQVVCTALRDRLAQLEAEAELQKLAA